MATVELDPHQLDAIGKMTNGCILKGGVGSGKTRTALAYFYTREAKGPLRINGRGDSGELKQPKDLYIITTAKKREHKDWDREAIPFVISTDRSTSVSGIKLTVDSWNNIGSYVDVKDAFFIFDEQRLVGSGAWVKAFYKIAKANRWIMLSATPGDNWMDYIPVLVANGFYKNRTEFIDRHVVWDGFAKFPKVKRYVEQNHLENIRRRIIVDMEFTRHTTRHIHTIQTTYDEEKFKRVWKDRWNVFDEKPIKDVGELFRIARRVVGSSPDRQAALMQLMEKHPKLIVFYNFNFELEMLKVVAISTMTHYAQWNGHKHEDIPETDKWLYFVQYTAGAEGWNCTETDAMVFFSLNYSYKIFEQALGRIDRMNTPFFDLYYYVLRSQTPIDNAIWKSLVTKRNFSERSLVQPWEDEPISLAA